MQSQTSTLLRTCCQMPVLAEQQRIRFIRRLRNFNRQRYRVVSRSFCNKSWRIRNPFPRHFMPRTRMSTPFVLSGQGFYTCRLLVVFFSAALSLTLFFAFSSLLEQRFILYKQLPAYWPASQSSRTLFCLQSNRRRNQSFDIRSIARFSLIGKRLLQRISLAESDVSRSPGCDNVVGGLMSIRTGKSRQQRRVSDSLQNPRVNSGARRSISCGSRS